MEKVPKVIKNIGGLRLVPQPGSVGANGGENHLSPRHSGKPRKAWLSRHSMKARLYRALCLTVFRENYKGDYICFCNFYHR